MDWRELLRNRWTWAGVAGAAGLGAIVWWRRRSTGGAPGGGVGAAAASPAYASGAVGSFDSTGTDVAAWLGQYSGSLDNQFKEFTTAVETRLAAIPAEQTGSGTPAPAPAPPPAQASTYLIPAGANIYDIAYTQGSDLNAIRALNPGLPIKWEWRSGFSEQYGNVPYLSAPTTVRLR